MTLRASVKLLAFWQVQSLKSGGSLWFQYGLQAAVVWILQQVCVTGMPVQSRAAVQSYVQPGLLDKEDNESAGKAEPDSDKWPSVSAA